jgi:hypothetical protein
MNIKSIAKALIMGIIMVILLSGYVFASDFSDVADDYWAVDTIKDMKDRGIIVGYSDGTYRPEKEVKKVEALIILSRILGINKEENSNTVTDAEATYKSILEKYDTYANREIAYLLQKGILRIENLDVYIGDGNDEKSMRRYETVLLLTRIMGKEQELSQKSLVVLGYKDAELIPQELRVYVEYLGSVGIMGDAGDNQFMPNGVITRAQIATLASRILTKTEDGLINNQGLIAKYGASIRGAVENVTTDENNVPKAIILNIYRDETIENVEIPISNMVEVIAAGQKSQISSIKIGDYVTVEINEKEQAIKITVENKNKEISGIITAVDIENKSITVSLNSETQTYKLPSSTLITKNGLVNIIEEIRKGDSITLYFEYNIIKSIELKSIQRIFEGIINEIIISKNPKLTIIKIDGNQETFELIKNVTVNVFNETVDIYGLRLGFKAKLYLDSNEVVKIDACQQIKGKIDSINISYGEVKIVPDNASLGESIQLLVNQDTKYISSKTKEEISTSQLAQGQNIIIDGKLSSSTFYVSQIILVE